MELSLKEIITVTLVLFAVVDPIGNIPIVLDLRERLGHIQSEKASIVAAIIMIVFVFVGETILKFIGIDVNSFAVAGAFVLFFMALEMVLGIELFKHDAPKTAAVFPLAFPLIAGAGTLTTILSLRAEYETENIITAIIINIAFVYTVLKSSAKMQRFLGPSGIDIIRKIFGVIILAISVKLFTSNISSLIQF
ncbi:MarC family protein [Salibacter sp.]|jgi:multiple antibiotic resistance protein|uniref:MarC family protein n=1 Tax=Salibacter sp. TaxID=2010995 RepID=UPI0028704D20|nr:MarC family protein [Salibacter sp.]MDR9397486.1 MarC family protein [Salibacter sp.]MDR9486720.1 MarC family protein [Salibacter sp.]